MSFNKHLELEGKHALLSPSKYHWLNYNDDDLLSAYKSSYAQAIGTSLHELAADLIKERIKMNRNDKHLVLHHLLSSGIPRWVVDLDLYFTNLMTYVNDAIGFRMKPEVILAYSDFCFGTADAISFRNDILRVHDLKTGSRPAHMEQLLVYAALYCLEYKVKPREIEIELRIYQSEEVLFDRPTAEDIVPIMDGIITKNKFLSRIREEED